MEILNVLAAALASFVYGAVHYTVLAKPWSRAVGLPLGPDGKPAGGNASPVPFVLSAVAMLLVAGMMRHIFAMAGIAEPMKGLIGGLGVGAFFIAPWTMINNAYPGRPFLLSVIDGAYAIIGCGLIGLVLNLF